MTVPINAGGPPGTSFGFGVPQPLFPVAGYYYGPIGTAFDGASATNNRTILVVQNWFNEVQARVH